MGWRLLWILQRFGAAADSVTQKLVSALLRVMRFTPMYRCGVWSCLAVMPSSGRALCGIVVPRERKSLLMIASIPALMTCPYNVGGEGRCRAWPFCATALPPKNCFNCVLYDGSAVAEKCPVWINDRCLFFYKTTIRLSFCCLSSPKPLPPNDFGGLEPSK
jgi:hypothetical protein